MSQCGSGGGGRREGQATEPPSPSGQEHHEDDEEDDEDEEDLHHEPAVGSDRLEVLQDLCVCSINIQLGVFHVGIDSGGERGR